MEKGDGNKEVIGNENWLWSGAQQLIIRDNFNGSIMIVAPY